MGLSKTSEFTQIQNNLGTLMKALGHPARIAILEFLIEKRTCICGEIVDELPLSQSTVSQHLLELKNAGLIKGNINGPKTCYCIDEPAWNRAKETIGAFMESYMGADCC